MHQHQIASIRAFLVQKMENLHTSVNLTKSELKKNDDKLADPLDMAAVEASNGIELHCRGKEWHLLLDIKETILRIDHGLFGICDHCGRPIPQKRLIHAPMSKLCIFCQEDMEARHEKSKRTGRTAERISYHHA